jgi:ATP-dependent DNA helicase RecQ
MCDVCIPSEEIEEISYSKGKSLKSKDRKSREILQGDFDQDLFEILRILRKKIADEENMPPYIVFSDVTLKDMASKYPKNSVEFLSINGVGEVKLKRYGAVFLEKITEYHKSINFALLL